MMEDLELFYAEVLAMQRSSDESINLARQIIKWKFHNLPMFPEDVLNYMIQENVITENEVHQILVEVFLSDKKTLDIVLPKKYNV